MIQIPSKHFILIFLLISFFYCPKKVIAAENSSDTNIIDQAYYNRFPDENMLVVQVNLGNNLVLKDGAIGYKEEKKFFLSLTDFSSALQFPIISKHHGTKAEGWFINEKKNFS